MPAGIFALVFAAGLVPWTVRNYEKFHHLIPLRDGFGMALRLGTPGAHAYHWQQNNLGPWHSDAEWNEFQKLGEYEYMQREQRLADTAIKETKKNGVFVIPGLGRLVKSNRKARMGRNPQTGEPIKIAAKTVCKFRVAKAAKDAIAPKK